MEIVVNCNNGSSFSWKRVRAEELNSVFVDVTALAEKDEAARKAFKGQSRLSGAKGKLKCQKKRQKA
jgi:hypothetical protein